MVPNLRSYGCNPLKAEKKHDQLLVPGRLTSDSIILPTVILQVLTINFDSISVDIRSKMNFRSTRTVKPKLNGVRWLLFQCTVTTSRGRL